MHFSYNKFSIEWKNHSNMQKFSFYDTIESHFILDIIC